MRKKIHKTNSKPTHIRVKIKQSRLESQNTGTEYTISILQVQRDET